MNERGIAGVRAREILDCRGNPTLEVDVLTAGGGSGTAHVPSGLSTGRHEARELRDGGRRYGGLGVRQAVRHVNEIIGPFLAGQDVTRQRELDARLRELDGTPDKSRLGANALLGVSLAAARAAAATCRLPLYRYLNPEAHVLPVPQMNLINGGKHAANDLDFQEFIIMPTACGSMAEALEWTVEVKAALGELLLRKYGKVALNTGDEGGFVPQITDPLLAFDLLRQAVVDAGHEQDVVYGLDAAASHLFDPATARYRVAGEELDRDALLDLYGQMGRIVPLRSIEDPLDQEDFEGFGLAVRRLNIQIVGDDLFVTSPERLGRGIAEGAANALLWKVNQIGTLSEAIDAAEIAQRSGYAVVVSERSGETEDPMIADLAVAIGAGQIKTGAPVRGERTAKYNRLLRIEEELGSAATYPGERFRQAV